MIEIVEVKAEDLTESDLDQMEEIKNECLFPIKFELNEQQVTSFNEFKKNHGPDKCLEPPYDCTGANFVFSFMPTGLGDNVWVTCGCGAKHDLTGDL